MRKCRAFIILVMVPAENPRNYTVYLTADLAARTGNWMDHWRPTFETYLSAQVSADLGTNISFSVKSLGWLQAQTSGQVDFMVSNAVHIACLQAEKFVVPLATIRFPLPGLADGISSVGYTALARKSDGRIN